MGGSSYFIVRKDRDSCSTNILIDTPANTPDVLAFVKQQGGVKYWVITHRGAIGEARALQAALNCPMIMQEQEAYLLPDCPGLISYQERYALEDDSEVVWTPGHSPGSACVYYPAAGGVLFTGRHLLPNRTGQLTPIRFAKTFHWPRQLQSINKLQAYFSAATLAYICPAANTGFLRRQYAVSDAYRQLQAIDVDTLRTAPALL